MPNKKDAQPVAPIEDRQLEERVDAMMDAERPDATVKPVSRPDASAETTDGSLPPLDIFAGQSSAPEVPKELLKDTDIKESKATIEASAKNAVKADGSELPSATGTDEPIPQARDIPEELALDDEVSDAAVDDIVAQEGDTVLAVEDAANRQMAREPACKPLHRHPIFWTLIAVVALAAIAVGILFATGGNISLPKL